VAFAADHLRDGERIKVAVARGPVSSANYHEVVSLVAPRPLLTGQAVGEHRPREENICAAVNRFTARLAMIGPLWP
jgi:hypothetical protein